MIDTLAGAKFFSTLDLISAYHAFEIHPEDREKTSFSTKQGHWQWKRVPFGLCNAAPSSSLRSGSGMLSRNMLGQLYLLLYLFYQTERFPDYTT